VADLVSHALDAGWEVQWTPAAGSETVTACNPDTKQTVTHTWVPGWERVFLRHCGLRDPAARRQAQLERAAFRARELAEKRTVITLSPCRRAEPPGLEMG